MRSASEGASRGPARLSAAAAAMDYLPVFLRLDGHPVVVVGGGTVALRKAAWLRRAGARVTVVAPGVHAELAQQAARGELRQIAEEFTPEHLAGAVAVVAATADRATNASVAARARELLAAQLTVGAVARLGEVYLIGAGPGDPDLLTLRALQLLQQADVILYDRLVSEAVLERARRDAERIFVGKESGGEDPQQRIHELLLRLAREGKRVARLKGGDPLVFGRGGEEIEVLAMHGIPCTVVPGITAALGAAAAAELPLTHRRLASSVTLIAGRLSDGALPDWRFLANPQLTVGVHMGVAQLPDIVARLEAAGAAAGHPAAIIERATLPGQRIVRGTLSNIVALAQAHRIEPPAILILGDVAAFAATEAGATPLPRASAPGVPA